MLHRQVLAGPSLSPWCSAETSISRPSGKVGCKREAQSRTGTCSRSHSRLEQSRELHETPKTLQVPPAPGTQQKPRDGALPVMTILVESAQKPLSSAAPRGLRPRTPCLPPVEDVLKIKIPSETFPGAWTDRKHFLVPGLTCHPPWGPELPALASLQDIEGRCLFLSAIWCSLSLRGLGRTQGLVSPQSCI